MIKTTPKQTTAEELFRFPGDGFRYELIGGELRMMSPAGGRHGRIATEIAFLLKQHVDCQNLGVVFAAETGFRIAVDPDTVIAPDVAFVSAARMKLVEDERRFLPFAPDLVVEVISPSDRFSQVESKSRLWLEHGTKLVLLVDPESDSIHAHRSRSNIQVYQRTETIDCDDAVASWNLKVSDVFQ